MPLGIKTAMNDGDGGDFLPIVKYMSEAGRLYKIDRVDGSNGFENVSTELPLGTRLIFDFGSVSVGWLHFTAGQAPSIVTVPVGTTMPPNPDKKHKQGFRILVMTSDKIVRELASSAKTLLMALEDETDPTKGLFSRFEVAPEAAQGKVPIVTFSGTTPLKRNYKDPTTGTQGTKTTFVPSFQITSWVDRPAAFGVRTVPPPAKGGTMTAAGAEYAKARTPAAPAAPAAIPPNDDDWEMPPPGSGPAGHVPLPGGGSIEDDIPFGPCWQ